MIWTQIIIGKSNGEKVKRGELKFQHLLAVKIESSWPHLEEFAELWELSWKPREIML